MKTAFYIAKRYLFSKKSTNAINIISGISMVGVFVGSAALIIILSAFNGLEDLVVSFSNNLAPDLRIEAAKGKTFDPSQKVINSIIHDKTIANATLVLQEKALLKYGKQQFIGEIKGVSNDFLKNNRLDSALIQGEFFLEDGSQNYAVIGSAVQYTLGVNINDEFSLLEVYTPNKNNANSVIPGAEFISRYFRPVGVFQSKQEADNQVILPLAAARELLGQPQQVSAIEVNFSKDVNIDKVKNQWGKKLGKEFLLKDKIEQNALLYKILNSEKWAVYLILTFVLLIATFNIVGSLTMLVIDKQKDIAVLNSLGANKTLIRRIFLYEGLMIALIGCLAGLIIGTIFCLLQKQYGFIVMQGSNMVVNAYPMSVRIKDLLLIFVTVFSISYIASYFSSRLSIKRFETLKQAL